MRRVVRDARGRRVAGGDVFVFRLDARGRFHPEIRRERLADALDAHELLELLLEQGRALLDALPPRGHGDVVLPQKARGVQLAERGGGVRRRVLDEPEEHAPVGEVARQDRLERPAAHRERVEHAPRSLRHLGVHDDTRGAPVVPSARRKCPRARCVQGVDRSGNRTSRQRLLASRPRKKKRLFSKKTIESGKSTRRAHHSARRAKAPLGLDARVVVEPDTHRVSAKRPSAGHERVDARRSRDVRSPRSIAVTSPRILIPSARLAARTTRDDALERPRPRDRPSCPPLGPRRLRGRASRGRARRDRAGDAHARVGRAPGAGCARRGGQQKSRQRRVRGQRLRRRRAVLHAGDRGRSG